MTTPITMIELFGGIGSQERAMRQLNIPFEVTRYCDLDKDATLSYAAMRYNLEEEMKSFEFPPKEEMIAKLQEKNIGLDFKTGKQTINERTNIDKLRLYYIANELTHNLGKINLSGLLCKMAIKSLSCLNQKRFKDSISISVWFSYSNPQTSSKS